MVSNKWKVAILWHCQHFFQNSFCKMNGRNKNTWGLSAKSLLTRLLLTICYYYIWLNWNVANSIPTCMYMALILLNVQEIKKIVKRSRIYFWLCNSYSCYLGSSLRHPVFSTLKSNTTILHDMHIYVYVYIFSMIYIKQAPFYVYINIYMINILQNLKSICTWKESNN
jgi:hypothetical protein